MTEKKQTKKQVKVPKCGYYLGTIYFYLTEGCNLRCRHCWINPKFQTKKTEWPAIDFELFKDIIAQGKKLGLSSVKLTGGEPFIHPKIHEILDHIAKENLGLTIETNGVECTPKIVKGMKKSKRPFISVSIDGADPETHEWVRGVKGSFNAAIKGIRNLVSEGIHPQVIMSIMRYNKDQMEAVVRLAEKEKCESVKFNLVTPTARGEKMHDMGETLSIEELIQLGDWVEKKLSASTKLRIVYSHPPAFRPLGKMFAQPEGRCGIFSIVGVLGSGKYALCGIGETVPDMVFGHAAKDKLADIWNNNPLLNKIRKGLPLKLKGICRDCLLKRRCLGSCIAMNYYRHQDLFAPFWYCEEAYKAGLFPLTRLKPGCELERKAQIKNKKN